MKDFEVVVARLVTLQIYNQSSFLANEDIYLISVFFKLGGSD